MKKILLLLTVVLFTGAKVSATEGMWLPYMLMNRANDMKSLGLQISPEEIYSVNNGSLKDAIVSFGGFCTGEIISDQGLVLTNHHCGYGAIQSHSSVEHNYLENGFWAMNKGEELPNDGLFVRFVKYIEDVTPQIMEGVNQYMTEEEEEAHMRANIEKLIASRTENEGFEFEVKPIFYGNQFILIASVKYNDVRLVGAPPSSIGKYGADTDNWVWPRHTGDFSMFRIYADANNEPAEYSENNVPFNPNRSLTVSLKGTQPGDFTMVYGFPGRTEEYLPAVAVEQMMEELNPMKIEIRDIILETMKSFMIKDEATDIQYASKYASTSNAWKKWIGQIQGIETTHGIDSIRRAEARFQNELASDNNLWNQYGSVIRDLEVQYDAALPYFKDRDLFIEIAYYGNEAFKFSYGLSRWVAAAEKGDTAAVLAGVEKVKSAFVGFYKDYNPTVDSTISHQLLRYWYKESAETPAFLADRFATSEAVNVAAIYPQGAFIRPTEMERVLGLLDSDPMTLAQEILNSEAYNMMMDAFTYYRSEVNGNLAPYQSRINALQKEYMAAQITVAGNTTLYPDANSTMRITYGQVEGFSPQDAKVYDTHTYMDGVIAKYVPGDYEFDLPSRVLELYEAKNYGQYANEEGKLPICFIASNHTSGGNSGSPALNGKGELIGLNFDRVWEGTMSDVYFDPSICRNIMVDIRYVLWVVDIYAGAGHLVEEMNIVRE